MMSKVFFDTNVLAYAMDGDGGEKRTLARKRLSKASKERNGVISTQVLQEFYVVATRKMGVEPLLAKSILHTFENMEVVTITPALLKEAIDCSILNTLSFWDALIIVAAESAHCDCLLSEDLNHGQLIRGVRIENPFRAG